MRWLASASCCYRESGLSTLVSGLLPCWQAPFPLLDLVQLLLALFELNGQGLNTERHARSGIIQRASRAIHVASGTFCKITGTCHLRTELLCVQHRCLSNPRCSSTTGLMRSVHRNNTSVRRPLIAPLWFVTNLSLRFLTAHSVVGGVIISGLGNSGTFTCTVPLHHADALDHGINALLLVPVGPKHSGLWHSRVLHCVHEVGDVLDPTSLVLICIANAVFTDGQREHCGRCSSLEG